MFYAFCKKKSRHKTIFAEIGIYQNHTCTNAKALKVNANNMGFVRNIGRNIEVCKERRKNWQKPQVSTL